MLFEKKTNLLFYCANLFVFLLRELQKKKLLLFTARTCEWSYGGKPEKKNSFYCTNSCVLIARTQPRKKNFFLLHKPVCGLMNRAQKKKVFLLHELDQKLVRNYYHIYVGKKNRHFVLCEIQKKSFYCKNSMKLRRVHTARTRIFFQNPRTVSKACQIHTQHISYRHQKKRILFDCANSQNKIDYTARTK